jgi:hypothetical protein
MLTIDSQLTLPFSSFLWVIIILVGKPNPFSNNYNSGWKAKYMGNYQIKSQIHLATTIILVGKITPTSSRIRINLKEINRVNSQENHHRWKRQSIHQDEPN